MESITLTGIGVALTGLAAVIGSVASFYMSVKNTKKIRDIDHAVNGKPAGAPTMQNQVADLHSDRPQPVQLPEDLNDTAIKQKLDLLLADMIERQRSES